MAIVSEVCTRALRLAGVAGTGAAPSAEDMDRAVSAYNEMLFAWALDGMPVGHDSTQVAADTVFVDDAYLKAVRYALAVELAQEFGTDLMPGVAAIAEEQKGLVRAALIEVDTLSADRALLRPPSTFNHTTGD